MTDEIKPTSEETKKLIEDAAKLLGLEPVRNVHTGRKSSPDFNPLDPERGDLMKVAMAAKLEIHFDLCELIASHRDEELGIEITLDYQEWEEADHDSLALAVLRAASAVLKAREGK